jgi:cytochrome bd-type quinol oxidase subunit 2
MSDQALSLVAIIVCVVLIFSVWAYGVAYFTSKTRRDPNLTGTTKVARYFAVAVIVGAWIYSVWEKSYR